MEVELVTGPPGCGKSDILIGEAATIDGKYLFACPTIDLAIEQAERFRRASGVRAQVNVLHSDDGARGTVGERIGKLPKTFENHDHAAVFITHEALLANDFRDFAGWHARIDETPNAVTSGVLSMSRSSAYYQSAFSLEPYAATGWSRVVPKGVSPSWKELEEDTLGQKLKSFHACAQRPSDLLISLTDFDEARSGTTASWFHAWTPIQLSAFDTVSIAGSQFEGSIPHRVCQSAFSDTVQFRERAVALERTGQPSINIYYFTHAHEGSTTFWESYEGEQCAVAVSKWFENSGVTLGYWSGNEEFAKLLRWRFPGKFVKPKIAGINRLRTEKSCAFFYSSKAVPNDKPLKDIFYIDDEHIRSLREDEDIFQFVCRGAIRDPSFGGDYRVFVYSRSQAERLAQRLLMVGFEGVRCEGIPEAGIMDIGRTCRRSKPVASAAEKKQRDRDKAAERQRRSRALKKLAAAAISSDGP